MGVLLLFTTAMVHWKNHHWKTLVSMVFFSFSLFLLFALGSPAEPRWSINDQLMVINVDHLDAKPKICLGAGCSSPRRYQVLPWGSLCPSSGHRCVGWTSSPLPAVSPLQPQLLLIFWGALPVNRTHQDCSPGFYDPLWAGSSNSYFYFPEIVLLKGKRGGGNAVRGTLVRFIYRFRRVGVYWLWISKGLDTLVEEGMAEDSYLAHAIIKPGRTLLKPSEDLYHYNQD